MLIRALVCGLMGGARLIELAFSRRNLGSFGETHELPWSRRVYPLIVLLHATLIFGTFLRGSSRPRWGWLALLLIVQPLRYWALLTLGQRWNARGAVPSDMPVATDGPYAFVRHPNYSVVAVELAALPAAFELYGLMLAATLTNALLLAVRIHEEESLLFELPGYREHFAGKPRFLPGVF